jgi:4-alpha-glucanotransferase
VGALKDRVLRRLFAAAPPDEPEFADFVRAGGPTLQAHALFEAVSAEMAREGHGAGWLGWPAPYRDCHAPEVAELAARSQDELQYHLWLQWQADRQLARVQQMALDAGMRVGLYLDIAVGAAADGSSTWADPQRTVPELKIGAPPDDFSLLGQDWGLAPISPVVMSEREGAPVAEIMAAVMRHSGAVRIDHAMSLARLWLIPFDKPALEGAYVRYPLSVLLARLAEASQAARAIVIGEDLGVVPEGFRPLMAQRAIHSYKVWFFERGAHGLPAIENWPRHALACLGTHDMATVPGWAAARDIELRERFGVLDAAGPAAARSERDADKARIARRLGAADGTLALSLAMHAHMASSPCRLAALQIEDALGLERQINVPGTTEEYPNWRNRLPVSLENLSDDPGFRAHTQVMREARPR